MELETDFSALPSKLEIKFERMEMMEKKIYEAIQVKYDMVTESLKQDEERIMHCETKMREMEDLERRVRTINTQVNTFKSL